MEKDLASSSESDLDEEGGEEEEDEEENAPVLAPPIPGPHPDPHIAQLIESLQSPYSHSTSAKDIDEMQNLQDYLDGGESPARPPRLTGSHTTYSQR
jgi:hypothetical protein